MGFCREALNKFLETNFSRKSYWNNTLTSLKTLVLSHHCVKSVQIPSYFWSVFSRIRTEYGEIRSISLYLVQMREMADQNNSEYRHFSRIVRSVIIPPMAKSVNCLTKVDQLLSTFVASKEIHFSMQSNMWLVLHVSPVTVLENRTVSLIYLFLLSIYDLVSELGCKQQTS